MSLQGKSLTQLRGIAQSFGVTDIFEKDALKLIQEIELKQKKMVPPEPTLPPLPQYDARLMTKAPARRSKPTEIVEVLEPYITMGLKLRLDDERWYMSYRDRNDEGPIRMPLRNILICAGRLVRGKI